MVRSEIPGNCIKHIRKKIANRFCFNFLFSQSTSSSSNHNPSQHNTFSRTAEPPSLQFYTKPRRIHFHYVTQFNRQLTRGPANNQTRCCCCFFSFSSSPVLPRSCRWVCERFSSAQPRLCLESCHNYDSAVSSASLLSKSTDPHSQSHTATRGNGGGPVRGRIVSPILQGLIRLSFSLPSHTSPFDTKDRIDKSPNAIVQS